MTLQRYDAALEHPLEGEAEIAASISHTLTQIAEKTFADGGQGLRGVHAKSHGLLKGELDVMPNLPPELAQGLFATPGRYAVIARLSTIPGDILDDAVSTPRGFAMKVLGVAGDRLEGSEGDVTQDFVMVNGPQFNTASPKAFLGNLKLVALTTDRAEGAKKALSAVMQRVEKVVETFGGESALAKALGGEPPTHILGETFYTQLPIRYGDYIAKIQLVPVSPGLIALHGEALDLGDDPNVIRTAVVDYFRIHGGTWHVRVQLCTNLDDMPIDDPTKVWDETQSPFATVAQLVMPPQTAWSPARSEAVDDGMGFNPWHGLAAHRPLGQFMRLRKVAYANSHRFRAQHNGEAVKEPVTLDDLPD